MKKMILLLLGIGMFNLVSAQNPEEKKDKKEKIEAAKIAFITQELALSPEEAQKFWPLYNQREAELDEIRKQMRAHIKGRKIDEMSDDEVEKSMNDIIALRQKELDTEKKFNDEFKKVLPVKKVAKLHVAEHKFKAQVMKEWKERQKADGPKGPQGKGPVKD